MRLKNKIQVFKKLSRDISCYIPQVRKSEQITSELKNKNSTTMFKEKKKSKLSYFIIQYIQI